MSPPSEHERHAQFLRHYAESEVALHTFVRSMLPDRHETSEVMQEVIVTLWQKFEGAVDFRHWAFGVARMKVLHHLQRRKRDRHVFGEELIQQLADRQAELEERHHPRWLSSRSSYLLNPHENAHHFPSQPNDRLRRRRSSKEP